MNVRDPEPTAPIGPIAFGPFVLDAAEARLERDGVPVALSGRPWQVLLLLAARPGRLIDKDTVLDAVWGHRHVTESVLKGAVNTLRAALADDAKAPRYIETVPRRGYRFIAALAPLRPQVVAPDAAPPPVRASAAPAATPRSGNLPPQAALVGREGDAGRLAALLGAHRLVTLTGLGGIGKTRLALSVAAGLTPPDGAWLLRLDGLTDPAHLLPALAQLLHLGERAAGDAAALAQALAPLDLLLVLDNAEHLVEAVAALVEQVLIAAPRARLLVTSQCALHLADERVLPLAPLALPEDLADDAPSPESYAAARLFCERVRQRLPGWLPAAGEHADIATICRGLDGVPLALELAAARVPLLGVAGVRARLDQRFALLTQGVRDAAARHRSLAAALEWTCSLLSAAEMLALQRLAVFAGSFDTEAAEAVLADIDGALPLDLVDALHQRSLLVAEAGADGTRLRLFDSVRRHALARLGEHGGEAAARQRQLAWLCRRFERADAEEFDTPMLRWLPPLRAEADNLRAALHFGLDPAVAPAVRDEAQRLLAYSAMYWVRSGQRNEAWRWIQAACALPASEPTRVLLDYARGIFSSVAKLDAPADGVAALERARPALRAAGDVRRCYRSLHAEWNLRLHLPQQDAVMAALRQEMRALVQPGWGALQRRYLDLHEAFGLRDRGDIDGYLQACVRLGEGLRAESATAECWMADNATAQGLVLAGQWDDACALLARCVAGVRAAGLLREQVPLVAVAACVHLRCNAAPATLALAREAVRLLQADGMLWWMADALPWAAWHAGRLADAARLQAWADALARGRGDGRGPLFARIRADLLERLPSPTGAADAAAATVDATLDEARALALAGLDPLEGRVPLG